MQIRENLIRENVATKFITIKHCEGKTNPADLFTKEDKDIAHFCQIRDTLVQEPFTPTQVDKHNNNKSEESTQGVLTISLRLFLKELPNNNINHTITVLKFANKSWPCTVLKIDKVAFMLPQYHHTTYSAYLILFHY